MNKPSNKLRQKHNLFSEGNNQW